MYVSSSKATSGDADVWRSSALIAAAAAPLASIQPVIITTSTGSSSEGGSTTKRWSSLIVRSPRSSHLLHRLGGHPRGGVDLRLEGRQLRRITRAEGAAEVAGVHALQDAGQLPVPEGDVEVEVREVAARHLGVALRR